MLAFDDTHGDAPSTVLLLHGWPLDRTIWSDVVERVAGAGFRVVCPDLPGFGRSPALGPARWSVEAYADEVAALVEERNARRVAVAGHSFGGYVALALAERHPALVAGIGLVASRTLADTEAARNGRRQTIEKVRAGGTGVLLPDLAAKLLAPGVRPALRERASRIVGACPPEAVIAGLSAMAARPDRTAVVEGFPRPVLVLHGAADQLIPASEAARVDSSRRGALRQILAGVGHMPMWEAPSQTAAALVEWASSALRL